MHNFPYQVAKAITRGGSDKRLNGGSRASCQPPCLIALKQVVGDRDYIDYCAPSAIRCRANLAMRTNIILPRLRNPVDWGLEIGVLSEAMAQPCPEIKSVRVEIADD